jgi:hypothetical protein
MDKIMRLTIPVMSNYLTDSTVSTNSPHQAPHSRDLERALDLYDQCIKGINTGVFSLHILISNHESPFIIKALIAKLTRDSYQTYIMKKTTTEYDQFHNHTYETPCTFLVIENPLFKSHM